MCLPTERHSHDPRLPSAILRVLRRVLGDEAREHRGGLLADQLGIVVLVELVELDQHLREPRLPAELPGPERAEQMQHRFRRHADELGRSQRMAGVAGMLPVEVIGDALSDAVELDPGPDVVAVFELPRFGCRQVLGFELP